MHAPQIAEGRGPPCGPRHSSAIYAACPLAIALIDASGRCAEQNPAADRLLGELAAERQHAFAAAINPPMASDRFVQWLGEASDSELELYCHLTRHTDSRRIRVQLRAVQISDDPFRAAIFVEEAGTPEWRTLDKRRYNRLQMLGRFVSGVVHDINTPVQFIGDSATFLASAQQDLSRLRRAHLETLAAAGHAIPPRVMKKLREVERSIDIDYLENRIPQAIERIQLGVQRMAELARAMQLFPSAVREDVQPIDINQTVRSALLTARSVIRPLALVEQALAPLPLVVCRESDIHQMLVNLIVQAAQAISAIHASAQTGRLLVASAGSDDHVVLSISHNGAPARALHADLGQIADGLSALQAHEEFSISQQIAAEYAGTLTVSAGCDGGATFTVRLPLELPEPLRNREEQL